MTLISIGFLSLGLSIILNFGITPLLQANDWIQHPTCDDLLACNSIPIIFTAKDSHDNVVSQIDGMMNVSSKTSFSVNTRINYEIKVTAVGSKKVSQIYFLLTPKDADISKITEKSPDELLTQAKNDQELIDLQPRSDNQFYRTGFWTTGIPTDIVLVGLILFDDHTVSPTDKTPVIVTIASQQDKTQAEQSQESRIINKVILGLTWMTVSLAPMLLGSDMILRVIFEG